ncbi:MAG: feruloyl-CoA synthase [Burkholderiaceae bacterium]|nr:feruloyl-CoA synthase [Burkholderiaceae bacterium]
MTNYKLTEQADAAPFRRIAFGPYATTIETRADGSMILRSPMELQEYPRSVTARLWNWADIKPDHTFLAKRGTDGNWVRLSYGEARKKVRSIAQALLDRGLSAERPVAILSENDIESALLGLAAMHVGIPFAPISPPYSLLSKDYEKLRHAIELLTPGLVFAADGQRYRSAIEAAVPTTTEVVLSQGSLSSSVTSFSQLINTVPSDTVEAAHGAVTSQTIAKFLFTSGSTKAPKAVINTHGMLCSNQQMFAQCFPFLEETTPVLVDWLPWHHTFGGNHNFGLTLYHGGTLYIDEGKPTPQGAAETIRNLREVAPTIYYTVPRGLEELVLAMEQDPKLCDKFFSGLQLLYPAGAALSPAVRAAFDELAVRTCGERIPMSMGLGMTETAPSALSAHVPEWQAGVIGLPVPGVELKLAPAGDKLEVRYRGPNVTPGYWRQPDITAEAFDEEGFFCSGDAARFINDSDPQLGLRFDGRIAEDFKLASGTWVNVGELRAKVISAGAPYVQDLVVAGHDRAEIGILIFLQSATARTLSAQLGSDSSLADIARDPDVRAHMAGVLAALNQMATGSSNRITKALLLEQLPSMELGECTDKGSINQRTTLKVRSELVDALFAETPDPRVIVLNGGKS